MRSPRSCRDAAASLLLAVTLLAPRPAAAQMDSATWTLDVPLALWMMRAPSGLLVVGTRKTMQGVDPATGKVAWERADLPNVAREWVDLSRDGVALLNMPTRGAPALLAIDLKDGHDLWKVPAVSLGHWFVPNRPALLAWLWRPGDRMTKEEFGGRMTMLSLADGHVLWEDPAFFATYPADRDATGNLWRVQAPVFDTDSTMLTFMSPMGVRRWNLATGRNLWAAELKLMGASSPFYGYAPVTVSPTGDVAYVPTGLGLATISMATGAVTNRTTLPGIPRQVEVVKEGLLLRGGSETEGRFLRAASTRMQRFMAAAMSANQSPTQLHGRSYLMLHDPATGADRWPRRVDLDERATNFVVRGDLAYVWSDNELRAITVASGESRVLAKLPGFRDDDAPSRLIATEAGLLLRGETNVQLVGYDGTLVHHTALKRPGRSFFVRAAASTMRSGLAVAEGNENDVLGALSKGGMVGVGDPDELRKRSTQTVHGADRSAMYSKVRRGEREDNGFTVFDASSGSTLSSVITGDLLNAAAFNDKQVDLAFDLEHGWIYYLKVINMHGEAGGWRLTTP